MDVWQAIRTRRSIGKMKADPVAPGLIEQMLEAATWAPNHHMTEPWKFYVMTGEGRRVLGRAYADVAVEAFAGGERSEQEAAQIAKQEQKAFRAPVVIAVAAAPTPGAPLIEELAAVHAAVQNMLLAAHALGLGAIWRTGEPAYHRKMKEAFGLQGEERLVGFVYVGYPDMSPPEGKRTPAAAKTVWLGG